MDKSCYDCSKFSIKEVSEGRFVFVCDEGIRVKAPQLSVCDKYKPECCKECAHLRKLVMTTKNGGFNYKKTKNCCILFTRISDRTNTYEDTVYEVGDIETDRCEEFTKKEDK